MTADRISAVRGVLGPLALEDQELGQRTTYRVGGRARLYCEINSTAEALTVSRAVGETGIEVLVLGRGSNLLVSDAGFDGLVVGLGEGLGTIQIKDSEVVAGAALLLPVLARKTVAAGLTGLEWAVGVPGSVGGAVRMNAGGHGADIATNLIDAETLVLGAAETRWRSVSDLALEYRTSSVEANEIVLAARFGLAPGDRSASEELLTEIVRWRRENQPGGQNSGSVFTNPSGDSAGRIIDACGLKGLRIGTAEVSTKHANFIQASPQGLASDVASVIAEVQRAVYEAKGIWLVPEVKMIGWSDLEAGSSP
jgi:UDP-N-acetylmuramate dehydrogenase